MIAEAIKFLQQNNRPFTYSPREEPDHIYLLANRDGNFEARSAVPAVRQLQVFSLDDMVDAVSQFGAANKTVVFSGSRSIFASLDEMGERRGGITFNLNHTAQWNAAAELSRLTFAHKDFIKHLTTKLSGCVSQDVIAMLRNLRFVNDETTTSKQSGGSKESLGRNIDRNVMADAGVVIPDEITLQIPVYEEFPEPIGHCGFMLNIDAANGVFSLVEQAGEMLVAKQFCDRQIITELRDSMRQNEKTARIPVFAGERLN